MEFKTAWEFEFRTLHKKKTSLQMLYTTFTVFRTQMVDKSPSSVTLVIPSIFLVGLLKDPCLGKGSRVFLPPPSSFLVGLHTSITGRASMEAQGKKSDSFPKSAVARSGLERALGSWWVQVFPRHMAESE